VIDIRGDLADTVAKEIQSAGGSALAIKADATRIGDVKTSVKTALERFGEIDVLVNNVGLSVVRPIMETSEGDWEPAMDINAKATFLWSKALAEHMIRREAGCIVNIASDLAKAADPYSGLYVAGKHAVIGMTKALALELALYGIRVNAVCPGIVDTPMLANFTRQLASVQQKSPDELRQEFISSIPLKRLATPDDVAGVVAFLASDDARYMTGQAINVTGGLIMY
jgi:NAD(P)-dependent dehydrogenase (short-subunit alcohol dehydrogenase family)